MIKYLYQNESQSLCMLLYYQFITAVISTTNPNYLSIVGLLPLLKVMSCSHFMAVETFLWGEQCSDLPGRSLAP